MGEILSHAEVEAILSGVEPPSPHAPSERATEVSPSDPVSNADAPTWEPHDFRRPEPTRGEVRSILPLLQSEFCHMLGIRLTSLLKSPIQVHPIGACGTTPREFLSSDDSPTIIGQVGDSHQKPHSLLVWQSSLAHALINQLLGGHSSDILAAQHRDLTQIELRLLARLNGTYLELLEQCLPREGTTGLSITSVHYRLNELPQNLANLAVVWVSFEIQFSGSRGLVHCGLLRDLVSDASRDSPSDPRCMPRPLAANSHSPALSSVEVLVSAQLAAKLHLRASDLAELQVGDILMTDIPHARAAILEFDGQPLFQAEIGTTDGRNAVRLRQPLGSPHSELPVISNGT